MGGDWQLVQELIDIFLAGSGLLLQQVSDAVTSQDADGVDRKTFYALLKRDKDSQAGE
jgi:hypothetical protein